MQPQIRAGLLVNYRATILALGHDPRAIIQDAGLREEILSNPESFIPYRDYLKLLDVSARATGNPDFGLDMSRQLGAENMGITGFVMTQANTVGNAWRSLAKFYHVHDTYGTVGFSIHSDKAQVSYTIPRLDLPGARQSVDMAAGISLNINRMLLGESFRPLEFTFPYPEPADLSHYQYLNAGKLRFDQPVYSMIFDASLMEQELIHSDPQMKAILDDYLAAQDMSRQHATSMQVEQMIRDFLATGECTLGHIARFMSMSERTLQKRLDSEHTSFQLLLEKVRRKLAIMHLDRGDLQLTQLASKLGYRELSSFSRSFKRWYGCSPKQWQTRSILKSAP